jgi:hypothetical protein
MSWKLILVALLVSGCVPAANSPTIPAAVNAAGKEAPPAANNWVDSDDNLLALRIYVAKPRIERFEEIRLSAEIRNRSPKPIVVLRPFGDPYHARMVAIKFWNGNERLKYSGPIPDYDIGSEAFVTLAPGATCKDTLEFPPSNIRGIERPGRYTLRLDYSHDGEWDSIVEKQGIKNAWRGRIGSREVQVERED